MAFYTKANYAFSTLAPGIAIDALSLTVAAGTGTRFPAAGTFVCVIWDAQYAVPDQDTAREIIEVTARSTDTFTIVRAREFTSAKGWDAGAKIANVFTAGTAAQYEAFEASQTAAAGKIPVTQNTSGDLKLLDAAKLYFGTDAYMSGTGDAASGSMNLVLGGAVALGFHYNVDGMDTADINGTLHATGQLKTTIATGTAPLAITSTTKVDNLNVDTVDGFHASQTAGASAIPVTAATTGNLPLIDGASLLWGDGSCKIAGSGATDIITITGSVGIGATPVNKLDIEGAVAIGASYSGTRTAPTDGMIVEGRSIFGGYTDDTVNQIQSVGPVAVYRAGVATQYMKFLEDANGHQITAYSGSAKGFTLAGGDANLSFIDLRNSVTAVRLSTAGNLLMNNTLADPTSMVGGMSMLLGTAPSASVTNTFQMYAADQAAGNTAPYFRTEAGHIIKLYSQAHLADPAADTAALASWAANINTYLENLGFNLSS